MWATIAKLFSGGVVDGITGIATEWIETAKETAEAQAVMIKALDPNGIMRRQISKDVTQMYKVYIYLLVFLVLLQTTGFHSEDVEIAINNLTDLFLPITGMFSAIVGASFGVNGINSHKGK